MTALRAIRSFFAKLPPGALVSIVVPVSLYFLLTKIFDRSKLFALVCAACVIIASMLWRAIRQRKATPLGLVTLVLLIMAIITSMVSKEPRIILIIESVQGLIGSSCIFVSSLIGRPLITLILRPFFTKGESESELAWDRCWQTSPVFRRRVSLLGYIASAVIFMVSSLSLLMIFTLPLDYAVPLSSIIGAVSGALAVLVLKLLDKPLWAGLHEAKEALAREGDQAESENTELENTEL